MGKKGLSLGKKSPRPKLNTREVEADLKARLKASEKEKEDLKVKYEEEKGFKTKYEDLVTERLAQFERIEDLKAQYEEMKTKYESLKNKEIEELKTKWINRKTSSISQPNDPSYEHVIYNLKNYEDLIAKVLTFGLFLL